MESRQSPGSDDLTQKSPASSRAFVSMELAISDRPLCYSPNTNPTCSLKTNPTVQAGPRIHWRCGISDLSALDQPYVCSDALRLRPSALSTQQSAMRLEPLKLSLAFQPPFYTTYREGIAYCGASRKPSSRAPGQFTV
jgi:hypothetical protein